MRIRSRASRAAGPAAGFTLLELMLTIGLIALTATFVGLNISRSDAKLADYEARRFVALVNMALDESIMTGRPMLLTLDAAAGSYRFAPMEVPGLFPGAQSQDSEAGGTDYSPQDDPFFQTRKLPEPVQMAFTRLPDRPEKNTAGNMVPKRVHEILNQSLFDREPLRDDEKEDDPNTVLIEPNGLISPFELALSVDDQVTSVGLDAYGKVEVQGRQ